MANNPPISTAGQLRLVIDLLRGQWLQIFLFHLLPIAALEAGVVLATRGVAGHLLVGGAAPDATATALVAGLVILFLAVRGIVVSLIWGRLMRRVAEVQVALSTRLFAAFLHRPYADLVADERSRMLESLRSASRGLLLVLMRPLLTGLGEALVALAIVAVLLSFAPVATLILLGWLALASGALSLLTARLARRFGTIRWAAIHELRELADFAFREIRTVRLSGAEALLTARHEAKSRRFARAVANDMALANVPRYFGELTLISAIMLLVLYFGHSVRELAVFAIAGLRLLPAAQRMVGITQQLHNSAPDIAQAVADLGVDRLDLPPVDNGNQPAFEASVQLADVAFSYRGGAGVAPAGTRLSLMRRDWLHVSGPSGIGKSTLVSILLGFLVPDAGQVVVDGEPTEPLRWFRGRAVALVPQEPCLITGSVAENLAFPHAPDRLDRASALDVLAALDLSLALDADVGDEGIALSGGQRQRLAIARAILARPDLCVLDEATSQLDGVAEDRVFDALTRFLPGVTLVVVAHQLHRPHRFTRRWLWEGAAWSDRILE